MDRWFAGTIGDLVTLQRGIDLPEQKRRSGPIPIMGSFGVTGFHDVPACRGPGVTVGRSGASIGTVSYMQGDYWPLNTCLYVKDFKGNDPRYCYYFLQSIDLARLNSGSAQPSLNRNFVHPVPAMIPPLHEQQAIASILGALDDKIELNQRTNATLETMARAIFMDWFVDFGPTRAKMEARASYLPSEIWALFPDRLGEDLKPIGWRNVSVDSLSEQVGMGPFGSNIKVETFVPEGMPIISGKHLNETRLHDSEFNFISNEHAARLSKSKVRRGDLIFTHAGNIGQVAIIPETSRYNAYILSQRQFYLRCDRQICSPLFMVYFFKSHEGQHKLLANTSQVGVPSIARPVTHLKSIELLLPNKVILDAFDSIASPLHSLMGETDNQSETLGAIRSLLLRKFMSGEVSVADVEKLAGEAA
jgi:type I restriction enzyme S subunit